MSFKVEYKGKVADIYRCSELVNSRASVVMRFFLGKAFSEKQRKVKTSERRRKNERTHLNYSRAEKERTTK
jgi:hypothetical protein